MSAAVRSRFTTRYFTHSSALIPSPFWDCRLRYRVFEHLELFERFEPLNVPPFAHLITLSALASTFGEIVRPVCFAAFKAMTSSNLTLARATVYTLTHNGENT
jgi:hypothetical protein